jgi:hypothetical protein
MPLPVIIESIIKRFERITDGGVNIKKPEKHKYRQFKKSMYPVAQIKSLSFCRIY